MRELRAALLAYYRRSARELPWRRRSDPYGVWVSEVMLQQTQVETVRPRYEQFLAEFPDVAALAAASEERVCEAWAGLGYYRRARNLHRAARLLMQEREGRWPHTAHEWAELPGVGPYTAGAIASIAFGEPVPAVDGNVVRVLARVFALRGRADEARLHRRIAALAGALVAGRRPGDVNQALMDIGATLCTPARPSCTQCPLWRGCRARASGEPTRYPRPAKPQVQTELAMALAWIKDERGVYLRRRPLAGLWPGLWELPSAQGPRARSQLARELGVDLRERLATISQGLTHLRVRASIFRALEVPRADPSLVAYRRPLEAPLSGLARRALLALAHLSAMSDS
jgi:A/G-specific adenine glycosylase